MLEQSRALPRVMFRCSFLRSVSKNSKRLCDGRVHLFTHFRRTVKPSLLRPLRMVGE